MPKHLGWEWECWSALVGVADSACWWRLGMLFMLALRGYIWTKRLQEYRCPLKNIFTEILKCCSYILLEIFL